MWHMAYQIALCNYVVFYERWGRSFFFSLPPPHLLFLSFSLIVFSLHLLLSSLSLLSLLSLLSPPLSPPHLLSLFSLLLPLLLSLLLPLLLSLLLSLLLPLLLSLLLPLLLPLLLSLLLPLLLTLLLPLLSHSNHARRFTKILNTYLNL